MPHTPNTPKGTPISKETRARNRAFLLVLIVMIAIFYGLGFMRINGGV